MAMVALVGCGGGGATAPRPSLLSRNTAPPDLLTDSAFGDLEAPCSDGVAKVDPAEAGRGTDKIWVGTMSDKGADAQFRLLQEVWDASAAFVEWCNAQGGIAGLPIGLVDLDAGLTGVESAMTTACTDVFALVGGGNTLDNLQFSGQPGSDFHRCGLIDVPAFTVTPEKSNSNGMVAPVPNRVDLRSVAFVDGLAETHPEATQRPLIVYGELDSLKVMRDQLEATMQVTGAYGVARSVAYPVLIDDWAPIAEQVKALNPTAVFFVGDPARTGPMMKAVRATGVDPLFAGDSNLYDETLVGDEALDGLVVRVANAPFEEADSYPAIAKYLSLMDDYRAMVPDAKNAALGVQSMSGWLLFAQGVKACVDGGTMVVTRSCVLSGMNQVKEWTGGGLHSTTDPADGRPSECVLGLRIDGGKFVRDFPAEGIGPVAEEADGPSPDAGYYCRKGSVQTIPSLSSTYGVRGKVDPAR